MKSNLLTTSSTASCSSCLRAEQPHASFMVFSEHWCLSPVYALLYLKIVIGRLQRVRLTPQLWWESNTRPQKDNWFTLLLCAYSHSFVGLTPQLPRLAAVTGLKSDFGNYRGGCKLTLDLQMNVYFYSTWHSERYCTEGVIVFYCVHNLLKPNVWKTLLSTCHLCLKEKLNLNRFLVKESE